MQSVKSSNIAAVGYDAASHTLAVRFTSGATYHYEGVSPQTHAALLAAKSIGAYFARSIRRRHPYRRVETKAA